MFSPKYFAESTTSRVWPWMLCLRLMMFLLLVMLGTDQLTCRGGGGGGGGGGGMVFCLVQKIVFGQHKS